MVAVRAVIVVPNRNAPADPVVRERVRAPPDAVCLIINLQPSLAPVGTLIVRLPVATNANIPPSEALMSTVAPSVSVTTFVLLINSLTCQGTPEGT